MTPALWADKARRKGTLPCRFCTVDMVWFDKDSGRSVERLDTSDRHHRPETQADHQQRSAGQGQRAGHGQQGGERAGASAGGHRQLV